MGLRTYIVMILFPIFGFSQNTMELRKNYIAAVENKTVCAQMIKQLENKSNQTLHLAYLGAYQTVWANHVLSPIAKFYTFNKGKQNLDKAIQKDGNNVELRILRFSVQNNAPKFLGYHKNIEEDTRIIKQNKHEIKDPNLLKLIQTL